MQFNQNEVVRFYGYVGEKIKSTREQKSVSQKGLSLRSGLSQSQLSRIEAGERAASLLAITRIAKALRISPGYLMK